MLNKLKTLPLDKTPPCAIYKNLHEQTGLRNEWSVGEWIQYLESKYTQTTRLEYLERLETTAQRIKNKLAMIKARQNRQPLTDAEMDTLADQTESLESINNILAELI